MPNDDPDVRFVIPGQPQAWARTGQRIAKNKKTGKQFIVNYTTGETRSDEWTLKRAAADAMNGRAPLDCAIDLRVTAWFAVPMSWSRRKRAMALVHGAIPITKPDFDNIAKLVDGIKGVVWRDDCLVADFHLYKRYAVHPRTVIEVRRAKLLTGDDLERAIEVLFAAEAEIARSRSPLIGTLV